LLLNEKSKTVIEVGVVHDVTRDNFVEIIFLDTRDEITFEQEENYLLPNHIVCAMRNLIDS